MTITTDTATATRAPHGVLVLHGLTSCLGSVEPVAERLAAEGIPYEMPWLRGHGTRPEDLVGVTWRDWYADAAAALDRLLARCASASVVGLSMGGLVALHLGLARPGRLHAVVAVAPALRLHSRLAWLVPYAGRVRPWICPAPDQYSAAVRERLAAGYKRLPTATLASMLAYGRWLEPRLGAMRVPTLILQTRADRVVCPDSAARIYSRLGAPNKQLVWFERSGHEMLVDCEATAVLDAIDAFLRAHAPAAANAPPAAVRVTAGDGGAARNT
jgi:carboxylesterase